MSKFIWLERIEDVELVSKALGKSEDDIESLLMHNAFQDQYSVFHIKTGERRDLSKRSVREYPRKYLETLFMDDLYNKAEIIWNNPFGYVSKETDDDGNITLISFFIQAEIDGQTYSQEFVAGDLVWLVDTQIYDVEYRSTLNYMILTLENTVKAHRYGPRR